MNVADNVFHAVFYDESIFFMFLNKIWLISLIK